MIKYAGCSSEIPFNTDIQQLDNVERIIPVAESYGIAMFQGVNGYVEIWLDDNKKYCCQKTNFGTEKKGNSIESICIVDEGSFQVGDKNLANAWLIKLKEWLTQECNMNEL